MVSLVPSFYRRFIQQTTSALPFVMIPSKRGEARIVFYLKMSSIVDSIHGWTCGLALHGSHNEEVQSGKLSKGSSPKF
jgi:hypothetical protein